MHFDGFNVRITRNLSHCHSWFSRGMKSLAILQRPVESLQWNVANVLTVADVKADGAGHRFPAQITTAVVCFYCANVQVCVSSPHMGPHVYIQARGHECSLKVCVWLCAFCGAIALFTLSALILQTRTLKLLVVHSCKRYWFPPSSLLRGSIPVQDNACEHAAENQGTSPLMSFFLSRVSQ